MIGSLRGKVIDVDVVADKGHGEVLLEVGDIGYRLTVTSATLAGFGSGETDCFLFVHHHFWDADQKLFGFATKDERIAFEALLTAHKVGPALALAILGTYPPTQLAQVLAADDVGALCDVPGVGKKTAQRLLVDLKSVLVLPVLDSIDGAAIDLNTSQAASNALSDVRAALESLGYSSEDIRAGVQALDLGATSGEDTPDSGELLKLALRALATAT